MKEEVGLYTECVILLRTLRNEMNTILSFQRLALAMWYSTMSNKEI